MPELAAHPERVARELIFAWQIRSNLRAPGDTSTEPYEDWIIADVAAALAACAREAGDTERAKHLSAEEVAQAVNVARNIARLEEAKRAEKLLDRYREKARLLVIQTGGSYESGEAIQFLVSDYEKYKQHVAALERAVGEKA